MVTKQMYEVYVYNRGEIVAKSLVKATCISKALKEAEKGHLICSTYNWRRYIPGMHLSAIPCLLRPY